MGFVFNKINTVAKIILLTQSVKCQSSALLPSTEQICRFPSFYLIYCVTLSVIVFVFWHSFMQLFIPSMQLVGIQCYVLKLSSLSTKVALRIRHCPTDKTLSTVFVCLLLPTRQTGTELSKYIIKRLAVLVCVSQPV